MCGRFALGIPKAQVEDIYGMSVPEEFKGSYNFAPGQDVLTFRHDGGRMMRWGLRSPWQKNDDTARPMINARSETVFDTVAFKKAVRTSRCLVPSQGFYEWQRAGAVRQPHCFAVEEGMTTLAGIFSEWLDQRTGETWETVAILTCQPNETVAPIHDRMPVILPVTAWDSWLNPLITMPEDITPLLVPYPADAMKAWPVSTRVNNVTNRDSALMCRVEAARQGSLF